MNDKKQNCKCSAFYQFLYKLVPPGVQRIIFCMSLAKYVNKEYSSNMDIDQQLIDKLNETLHLAMSGSSVLAPISKFTNIEWDMKDAMDNKDNYSIASAFINKSPPWLKYAGRDLMINDAIKGLSVVKSFYPTQG